MATKIYFVFLNLRCIHASLLRISHCIFRSEKDKVLINICSHMATLKIWQGHQNLSFILIINEIHWSKFIYWLKGLVNVLYLLAVVFGFLWSWKLGKCQWNILKSPLSQISIKYPDFTRLVHSIESKQEATPCMSEVLVSKAMFFPLFCSMDEIITLFSINWP